MIGVVPENDPDFPDRAGWFTIPYITPGGIVDIRFRRPPESDSPAKYKSLPGSSPRLYNPTSLLLATDMVVIAEGEADCMALSQVGLHAVAVPGASAWRKPFALALQGFENILICQDGDDKGAGAGLTEKIMKDMDWAKVVHFPGHDVNSYALEYGFDALREHVLSQMSKPQSKMDDEELDYYEMEIDE